MIEEFGELETESNGHQIISNGKTVWVNGPDGCCVGRFDKVAGIDVHYPADYQMRTGRECRACSHAGPGGATITDWNFFVDSMLEYYKVEVSSDHCPGSIASSA